MDPQTAEMFLAPLREAYAAGGWLGLAAALLVAAVNLYQLDFVQSRLAPRFQWSNWPTLGRIAFVFFGSFAGALATGIVGAMTPMAAALSALGVGLTAVLGHRFILAPAGRTGTVSAAAAALPALARLTSIVLPLDMEKVAKLRAEREANRVLK
jgi:hypothetical protein